MKTASKIAAKDSCNYALNKGNSNETNIKVTQEIAALFGNVPKPDESYDVSFYIEKGDFLRSLCQIMGALPLYNNKGQLVPFSEQLFKDKTKAIYDFFGEENSKEIKAKLTKPGTHPICLNFGANNFCIRDFLVESRSILTFTENNGKIKLNIKYDDKSSVALEKSDSEIGTLQQIFYGAPGTGKSYAVNKRVKDILKGMSEEEREKHKFRTTFHPDSDYASFVGCYKPMKEKTSSQLSNSNNKDNGNMTEADLITELQAAINSTNNSKTYNWYRFGIDYYKSLNKYLEVKGNNLHKLVNKAMNFGKTPFSQDTFIKAGMQICEDILLIGSSESKITYSFVPQSFTNAYVAAWNDLGNSYFLIIEEINRGNCAQVFGDLFQLLDRKEDGTSDYTIKADNDLRDYLEENLTNKDGIKNGELSLPPNLYIWATMNTSDQSLFPMDSAFKRRWDWEYMPICYDEMTQDGKENKAYHFKITINGRDFSWINFLRVVNLLVKAATDSEDKQMGNFFIKHDVEEKEFISKVMYYLWSEVCKDNFGSRQNFFRKEDDKEFSFNELFDDKDHAILLSFMKRLQKEADVRDELKDKGIVIEKDVPAKEKKEEPIDTQEESE